jgi:pimeloyl-ACP methyl ester carboxylesterase
VTDAQRPSAGLAPVRGTQLYFEQGGQGTPLVLIHAGIADSRMWDDQWTALTARHRTIRYDVRGFGRSGPHRGPFSHVDDLARLLDYLDVERAALLGASMGGTIAIDFTLTHPARVSALITAGAGLGGYQFAEQTRALWRQIGAAFDAGDPARAVELELRMWVDGPDRTPDRVSATVRERVRVMETANVERNAEEIESEDLEPPAIGRLAEVKAPALVLVGDYDVPDMLAIADLLAGTIPGARKLVLPDTAHLPNMEQPAAFTQAVVDFLDAL